MHYLLRYVLENSAVHARLCAFVCGMLVCVANVTDMLVRNRAATTQRQQQHVLCRRAQFENLLPISYNMNVFFFF